MIKWNFTVQGSQLLKTATEGSGNTDSVRTETFASPTFNKVNSEIKISDAGVYKTAITLSQINEIGGVVPTDLDDALSKLLALVENFNGGGTAPDLVENTITFKQFSAKGDFKKAHSLVYTNNKAYLGTRENNRILCYNDLNNLKDVTIVDLPGFVSGNGIETMFYDEDTDKIYFPIGQSTKIGVINDMDDITDWTIHDIDDMGLLNFSGSSPIIVNENGIWICSETTTNPSLFRINKTTFALMSTTPMPFGNGQGAHTGICNTDKSIGYFANNGDNCGFASVTLDNSITITVIENVGLNAITDDSLYIPQFPFGYNSVMLIAEFPNYDNKNAVFINVDDMEVGSYLDCLPSFGATYNETLNLLYMFSVNIVTDSSGGGLDGFIELIDLNKVNAANYTDSKNVTDVYPIRGVQPNEGFIILGNGTTTFDRLFVTNWNNDLDKANFQEVSLTGVQDTVLTKSEFLLRYYASLAKKEAFYYVESQDFNGLVLKEIRNNTGIEFTTTYVDVGKNLINNFNKNTMTVRAWQADIANILSKGEGVLGDTNKLFTFISNNGSGLPELNDDVLGGGGYMLIEFTGYDATP